MTDPASRGAAGASAVKVSGGASRGGPACPSGTLSSILWPVMQGVMCLEPAQSRQPSCQTGTTCIDDEVARRDPASAGQAIDHTMAR